jgi:EAL domain-containing protein (putative c-di-GMP-specific phosphodiesterase class I)
VLKVDKSFVDPVAAGGSGAALAGAIVALGVALGLRTVAEGIESAEQAARLGAMGCALGQGFYFAGPLDADEVAAALAGDVAELGSANATYASPDRVPSFPPPAAMATY